MKKAYETPECEYMLLGGVFADKIANSLSQPDLGEEVDEYPVW